MLFQFKVQSRKSVFLEVSRYVFPDLLAAYQNSAAQLIDKSTALFQKRSSIFQVYNSSITSSNIGNYISIRVAVKGNRRIRADPVKVLSNVCHGDTSSGSYIISVVILCRNVVQGRPLYMHSFSCIISDIFSVLIVFWHITENILQVISIICEIYCIRLEFSDFCRSGVYRILSV